MLHSRINSLLRSTATSLRKELENIEEEKARLTADLDEAAHRIAQTLAQLGYKVATRWTGRGARRGRKPGFKIASSGGGKKRIRRNPDQLKKYADSVYQLIRGAGSEGASGGDIRRQYPNVGQDIKGFLQKHGGHRVRTTGQKSFMRYHA